MSIDVAALVQALSQAPTLQELEAQRVTALGKKGSLTQALKSLGQLDPEARRAQGQAINAAKQQVLEAYTARKQALEAQALEAQLAEEALDITLPPASQPCGALHPISRVLEEVAAIFQHMDFATATGPDVEDDFHNFTALNFPADHPARQMHDTFYLKADSAGEAKVLRTHTSPVQIRAMKTHKPPLRILAAGRTYRSDSDQTHTPMFHQVEGLVIDKDIHMGHLKGCLQHFLQTFFEVDQVNLRFRPSYFPFTEPSAEVDIAYSKKGNQLILGEGEHWLEILGCGMVHRNVLSNCGVDPKEWQGFAFGVGVERLAMLKYGIADLRTFFDADLRWLKHYGFIPYQTPSVALRRGGEVAA